MTFKKLATLAMATVVSASLLVGCSGSKESAKDDKITVAMITDVAGVNDQSFNQSAWEGLQRAEKELGIEVKYLESKQDSDYATNIETLVDENVDLILGVGMKLADAIKEGAELYPEQNFVLVDKELKDVSNVKSILFKAEESAYLAGLIAGKTTKTNNVGFIGGMELPVIDTFKYGFMAGVKAANPDAKVQSQYANSFTDQAKGKAIANQMYSNGADIVFTCGGDVGTGAIEAAKENGKKAIGVDQDQNSLAPENVITSAMKNIDVSVEEMLSKVVDGSYKGGEIIVNTLAMNGVGIPQSSEKNVPPDVLTYVKEEAEKVKSGEVKVPATKEEFEQLNK